GTTVLQNYTGGTLQLWDPAGVLLLGLKLGGRQLVGNTAPLAATGGEVSTTLGSPIPWPAGGGLGPPIAPNSLGPTIGLIDVNNGAGLSLASSVSIGPGISQGPLNDFSANATGSLAATGVPEPATISLIVMGFVAGGVLRRRHS